MTPSRMELDGLFRSASGEERLAALDLALQAKERWDKRWGGLFLRWARQEDSFEPISDKLGAELLGPLWLAGEIEARQLAALALWPTLWPWRTGLMVLAPSLARGGSDWPLFESFAKACLGEEARFRAERKAFKAVRKVLKAGLRGCPDAVTAWVDRHEPELPGFVVAAIRPSLEEFA